MGIAPGMVRGDKEFARFEAEYPYEVRRAEATLHKDVLLPPTFRTTWKDDLRAYFGIRNRIITRWTLTFNGRAYFLYPHCTEAA